MRDPLLPMWFTTYRPRKPVAPNTVAVMPLWGSRGVVEVSVEEKNTRRAGGRDVVRAI